ncbi:MAG: hypothetical protein ACEY3A_02360 [Wolbachia sp.]
MLMLQQPWEAERKQLRVEHTMHFLISLQTHYLCCIQGLHILHTCHTNYFHILRGTNGPESLVGYANNFQNKAEQHGETCAKFISSVLSYGISAVIRTAALIVTPLTWTVDKVSSKFSETKTPEGAVDHNKEMTAAGN